MDHVITLGDLFWPAVGIGGVVLLLVLLAWVASIFADTWKH